MARAVPIDPAAPTPAIPPAVAPAPAPAPVPADVAPPTPVAYGIGWCDVEIDSVPDINGNTHKVKAHTLGLRPITP